MPVTPGHFTLNPEQRQFKQLLDQHPTLTPFWDFESRDCDLGALERSLPAMSHGEQIMARFFTAVWLGENKKQVRIRSDRRSSHSGPRAPPDHRRLASQNPVFP